MHFIGKYIFLSEIVVHFEVKLKQRRDNEVNDMPLIAESIGPLMLSCYDR